MSKIYNNWQFPFCPKVFPPEHTKPTFPSYRKNIRTMGGIQDLPNELLFLIMEYCGSELLPLMNVYPTALRYFSNNRKCFVARMSNRFGGDLDFPSFVRAAHLRYIRQERDFASLGTEAVEDKRRQVFDSTCDTAPLELHKFSVSAL